MTSTSLIWCPGFFVFIPCDNIRQHACKSHSMYNPQYAYTGTGHTTALHQLFTTLSTISNHDPAPEITDAIANRRTGKIMIK